MADEHNNNERTVQDEVHGVTPIPTDLDHAMLLMRRQFRNDRKNRVLWFARTFGVCGLLMLYTMGFFLSYPKGDGKDTKEDDGVILVNDQYVLYPQDTDDSLIFPNRFVLSVAANFTTTLNGTDRLDEASTFLDGIEEHLRWNKGSWLRIEQMEVTETDAFIDRCSSSIVDIYNEVCIYFRSDTSYAIYYDGDHDFVSHETRMLANAQRDINAALLNVSSVPELHPIEMLQRIPATFEDDENVEGDSRWEAPLGIILAHGVLLGLALMIAMSYVMVPLTAERIQHVSRAFQMVGVKLRVYMLQWVAYLSMMGIFTAVGLTAVCIGWRLYPMSSPGLIFLSHYLALVQLFALAVLVSQNLENEEAAKGIPFLTGIFSFLFTLPILLVEQIPEQFLHIMSVISPFSAIVNYSARYSNYDTYGFDTGISVSEGNVASSGLLAATMSQVAGVCLWIGLVILASSPKLRRRIGCTSFNRATAPSDEGNADEGNAHDQNDGNTSFEALPSSADVLVSVRGLHHSFRTDKKVTTEVLKGLDMTVCRGEVFGFLGHNGAGKTTTIRLLSGELDLQDGEVSFHFVGGTASAVDDMDEIRKKIGVCPQHNETMLGNDTCRETLRLFAALKGQLRQEPGQSVTEAIEAEVDRRLKGINFTSAEDADKPVKTFSGGMKRKVNIAISLLGDPEVVFLDEPTAGMDPYNRRQIWDMIVEAKEGRSIILTTHFMDEADILSDRVGIIKKGRLVTCGRTLFLKHQFGAGYTLSFEAPAPVDVASVVGGDGLRFTEVPTEGARSYQYNLGHGTEATFPVLLSKLEEKGAVNVTLELTTLEHVFVKTGKEEGSLDEEANGILETSDDEKEGDVEERNLADFQELLARVWERRANVSLLSFWPKFLLVEHYMMSNNLKMNGAFFLNFVIPLIYLSAGMMVVGLVGEPSTAERVVPEPTYITPYFGGSEASSIFGGPSSMIVDMTGPFEMTDTPKSVEDYFRTNQPPIICGYWAENQTLQYNATFSGGALQVCQQVFASYSLSASSIFTSNKNGSLAMETALVQLPFDEDPSFRTDELILPMVLILGYTGLVLTVLDVLILKGDNIISLFRVAGITEWTAYVGVALYKILVTFIPFVIVTLILSVILGIVLLGDGGRWLATVTLMFCYAYSVTPAGLLISKLLFTGDYNSVRSWFPSIYMTFISVPYTAWNIALQSLPDSRDSLLVVGDLMCILPPVAFMRGIGAVIDVSTEFDDPDLTWATVWSFKNRVSLTIGIMLLVGTFEWRLLYRRTVNRPAKDKIPEEERAPIDIGASPDVVTEREQALKDDEGINARDLVKVFCLPSRNREVKMYKKAVKGLSFGLRKNEVYVLLGPNGAGKTVTMKMLSAELRYDHGSVALAGEKVGVDDANADNLFARSNISICPQFDALFQQKTVMQHLEFYAKVRGLDVEEEATEEHVEAIVKLLGLEPHMHKTASELSGGYKRRLSLAVAMVGFPECMMVDECTTGIDTAAKRLVWRALKPDVVDSSLYDMPAILLSTHSMDEASKLGSRIGIMIDGELVATGALSQLQQKFCNSYFVEVALKPNARISTEDEMLEAFRSEGMEAMVYEALPFHFKLQIPFGSGNVGARQLARIFHILETQKERLDISFYGVAQMSLEQIFIDLSRKHFAQQAASEVMVSSRNVLVTS